MPKVMIVDRSKKWHDMATGSLEQSGYETTAIFSDADLVLIGEPAYFESLSEKNRGLYEQVKHRFVVCAPTGSRILFVRKWFERGAFNVVDKPYSKEDVLRLVSGTLENPRFPLDKD